MSYYVLAYLIIGLITSVAIYILEEDEWEEEELVMLIHAFVAWPILLIYILGYAATRPLIHLRKRIHRKKETLPKENMPSSSPPRAGTLWEEETRTPENFRR